VGVSIVYAFIIWDTSQFYDTYMQI